MTYRSDLEAAQARATALEDELEAAKKRINELEHGSKALAVVEKNQLLVANRQRAASRWMGGPTTLEEEREIDGELTEQNFVRIVDYLRRAYGHPGQVTTMPGSYAWTANPPNSQGLGPFVTFYFTVADGKTQVRADQRLGNTAGAIFGGVGGGVGGGAIVGPALLFSVSIAAGAIAVPLWLGGVYWGCRKLYRRSVRKHRQRLDEVLTGVVELAETLIRSSRA